MKMCIIIIIVANCCKLSLLSQCCLYFIIYSLFKIWKSWVWSVADSLQKLWWIFSKFHRSVLNLSVHTRQELSWYFLNCVMGSEGSLMTPATWGTTPNAQPNHGGRVFWKNHFLHFLEPKKCIILGFGGP